MFIQNKNHSLIKIVKPQISVTDILKFKMGITFAISSEEMWIGVFYVWLTYSFSFVVSNDTMS